MSRTPLLAPHTPIRTGMEITHLATQTPITNLLYNIEISFKDNPSTCNLSCRLHYCCISTIRSSTIRRTRTFYILVCVFNACTVMVTTLPITTCPLRPQGLRIMWCSAKQRRSRVQTDRWSYGGWPRPANHRSSPSCRC